MFIKPMHSKSFDVCRFVDFHEKLHLSQKYSPMAQLITISVIIKAAGNKEKIIKEYFGRVNSNTEEVSIAMMKSPQGWEEPGQCPEFNEYTACFFSRYRPQGLNIP
jgi:hypothetical protein